MLFRRLSLLLAVHFTVSFSAWAQKPHQPSSSEIFQDIRKLGVLGNVLYVAAHPDDENTRFIAYCVNEKLYNTHYLSLTRGDGGQNLIGSELREELGIIRTQELLAARRVDGGTQSFSRANDFGYSKTSDETLQIWDRDAVLHDVVRTIRRQRPDIIVCRFPIDGGGGHGHHTASAILANEAFDLAADLKYNTGQPTWQAKRIVVNTGRWWNADISADDPGVVMENVNGYNAPLGLSYNEMAAQSRSCHQSQGFGSTGVRGEMPEYFEHLKGDQAEQSLFDGVRADWSRVEGAAHITAICERLVAEYDIAAPHKSVPGLIDLRKELSQLKDGFWNERKIGEVNDLIRFCTGLYFEAVASDFSCAPGDSIEVSLELVNRSKVPMTLKSVSCTTLGLGMALGKDLGYNEKWEEKTRLRVSIGKPISQPYWLVEKGTLGTYQVDNPLLTDLPENPPTYEVGLQLDLDGQPVSFTVPLVHKWNDPVDGESYRPFIITPPVMVAFTEELHLFPSLEAREVGVKVKATKDSLSGELRLSVADGWSLSQTRWELGPMKRGEELLLTTKVTPSQAMAAPSALLRAEIVADGMTYDRGMRTITHNHIPTQVHFPLAVAQLVHVDLQRKGQHIGYLQGAGDGVDEALRAVGYTVDELVESDLAPERLAQYDAIILGIRFLNVNDRATYIMPRLMEYAKSGGTLIMQYNTSRRLETEGLLPLPLTLGRDRVTEEDAVVTLLRPEHPALTVPNRITSGDFNGWVQERGLYFPSEWDENYVPLLRMNDTGETPQDGSLLVAEYGEGHFVYTGISFFRELPAGVPGAYRLMANLIGLGQ